MMNSFLLGFFVLTLNSAFSADVNCLLEAKNFLKEPNEFYLFESHISLHAFADCERPTKGIDVIIHEAVHFEDLGAPAGLSYAELKKWHKENPVVKANFINLNNKHVGSIELSKSPSPKKLVMGFLKQNYPNVMKSKKHPIHEWLDTYILDKETFASTSFPNGLTELNAYIHGLRVEYRIIETLAADNPYKNLLGQRHGLWHFLFVLKAYLYELKFQNPRQWAEMSADNNSNIISSMLKDALEVLSSSNHCNLINEDEIQLFSIFSDRKYFDGLSGVIKNTDDLNKILCIAS